MHSYCQVGHRFTKPSAGHRAQMPSGVDLMAKSSSRASASPSCPSPGSQLVLSISFPNAPQSPSVHPTAMVNWRPTCVPLAHCHGLLLASLPLAPSSLTPHTYLPLQSSQNTNLTRPLHDVVPPHAREEARLFTLSCVVSSHLPQALGCQSQCGQVADM